MNSSLRTFQIAALILVLAASALLASGRLRLPGRDPVKLLSQDVQRTVNAFWDHRDCKVSHSGTPQAAELVVTPAIPPNTRPRQLTWVQPLVEFVVARYPEVKVERIEMVGLPAVNQAKERAAARRPSGFQDPTFFEDARAEVLQRNLQLELDAKFGKGSCLGLVDVVATTPGPSALVPSQAVPRPEAAEFESRESLMKDRSANSVVARRQARPPVYEPQVARIEARLVVLDSAQVAPAEAVARTSLELQEGRGDTLRTLPLGPRL